VLGRRFDAGQFADRATAGIGFGSDSVRAQSQVLSQSCLQVVEKVVDAARPHDGIRFLRLADTEGERRMVFRFLFTDGKFNYLGFSLAAGPNGTLFRRGCLRLRLWRIAQWNV